jgi:NADP-dependent 3-hydroxy acid dehydrogenase YdfG
MTTPASHDDARPLSGRKVLVSGGSAGIGAAVARACADAGAAVGVIGRDQKRLDAVADSCGAATASADLMVQAETRRAVSSVAESIGGIDVLVNSAGMMLHSRLSAGLSEDWEQMFGANVLGLLHVTHASLEYLRDAEVADIVNLSSVAADEVAVPDFAVYSATKASVSRLTEGIRKELAKEGDIRVCSVKPGTVRTDGFGPGIRDAKLREQVVAHKEATAMEPSVVADQIVHVIALPRVASITEITIVPHRRP